jgi:DNA-binding transcriptional LysR family regulator
MFERSLEEEGITYRSIEFSSGSSLRQCLRRGVGISLSPRISVHQSLKKQTLQQLKTKEIITETPVVMIWHIDKWCSALLKLFMDLTKECITED